VTNTKTFLKNIGQMVAGRPLHCRPSDGAAASSGSFFNFASQSTLVSPTSISFSLQGDLYLAESDSRCQKHETF
jgi:hypothetical protein